MPVGFFQGNRLLLLLQANPKKLFLVGEAPKPCVGRTDTN